MRQQQLQKQLFTACCICLCSAIAMINAIPLPASNQELDLLQIPLANGKEIDVLTLGAKDEEQLIADRNKRTIGLLRELFPDITKEIDAIVNRIIAQVIRVAGPGLLSSVLNTNRSRGSAGGATTSFDASFDDDDDDDDDDADNNEDNADDDFKFNDNKNNNSNNNNGNGNNNENSVTPSIGSRSSFANNDLPRDAESNTRVKIDLPTFAPDNSKEDQTLNVADAGVRTSTGSALAATTANKTGATDTQIDLSAINKQLEETIRVARQVKEAEAAAQAVAATSPVAQAPIPIPIKSNEQIQLSFNNELPTLAASSAQDAGKTLNGNDLQLSESKSPAIDELTLDSAEETADLDDRNKRFLTFGGAGLAGGSSGGGGGAGAGAGGNAAAGGSGNFLLDIVRLFSGSIQTQAGDEAANSVSGSSSSGDSSDPDSDSNRAADGYTEGIPGPVTRLVVLANRGLANLVQDLILRVAATSEKFVNFKAKLITALI